VYHVKGNKWRRVGTQADAHAEYAQSLRRSSGELGELIDAALARITSRKVKPLAENTKRQYGECAEILKDMLRAKPHPRYVRPEDAADVKALLADTPGMANRVISFGRVVFSVFRDDKVVSWNPFLGLSFYPKGRRTRLIKQDEWDTIYDAANARLKGIMDGMFLTDQRVDDVIGIDERNILDDGPGIYFRQKKTKKEIIIAWNPQLREWVARCRALHGNVPSIAIKHRPRYLFRALGARRPAYKTILSDWLDAVRKTDVKDVQMRDSRAFAATEAQRQGLSAQKVLGHTDERTTRIYLRGREVEIVQGPQMLRTA
jgi:integrase